MSDMQRFATFPAVLFVLGVFCTEASAQEVTAGQTEVVGFVGGVTDGGGLTLGGGIHYAIDSRWLFVSEVGYLTGGEDFAGFGVDVDSDAISVDVNAHYLFLSATATSRKFIPYALGGLGIVRARASVSGLGISTSVSDTDAGLNLGVGARWQRGERWGVRPELKVLITSNSSVRFSVGIYRKFGS